MKHNKSDKHKLLAINIRTIDITTEYVEVNEADQKVRLMKLEVNGKCQFDDFLNIKPQKINKKDAIIEELDAYLTLLIQGDPIPPNKLHTIGSNEFEIRVKRTRLYFFFDHPNKNIIVLGHYNKKKDNQQEYIDKFRKLKTNYLNQKK